MCRFSFFFLEIECLTLVEFLKVYSYYNSV